MFHFKIFRKFLLGGRPTGGAVCAAVVASATCDKDGACGIHRAMDDASKSERSSDCKSCQAPTKVRPSELPIYGCEEGKASTRKKEEEPSKLEVMIGAARKELWVHYDQIKELEKKAVHFVETGKAHSESAITYLQEEATTVHRAGAIGIGGLAGIIMGLRGGWFKRLFYGSAGASAMAAICYPHEASEVGHETLHMAKYYFTVAYNFIYGVKPEGFNFLGSSPKAPPVADKSALPEKKEIEEPPQVEEEIDIPEVTTIPPLNVTPEEVIKETYEHVSTNCSCPDPAAGSHNSRYPENSVDMDKLGEMMSDIFYWGFRFIQRSKCPLSRDQSNPADKDLYTTRK